MKRYGTPEFSEFLNMTRLGSYTEMVRFMARVGKDLSEPGAHFSGTGSNGGAGHGLEKLYPSMVKK